MLGQGECLAHAFDTGRWNRIVAFLHEFAPEADLGAQQSLAVASAVAIGPTAFGTPLILEFHNPDL